MEDYCKSCEHDKDIGFCDKCLYSYILEEKGIPPTGYKAKQKPITNADRIRSMTDEELAVVIAWPYIASPPWCAEHTTCPYISKDPTPCDKCALDWLREEVE